MSTNRSKTPNESLAISTTVVLPNDTNTLNNLMGGQLMNWMDIIAAIAAQKHSNCIVVTASVDNLSFKHPIKLGQIVTLEAKVTRAFNSSMEVNVLAYAEDYRMEQRLKTNEAFLTFVALDKDGNKVPVPEVTPETEQEINLFEGALRRRQVRLVLAGKMKASEANELRNFLNLGMGSPV